VGRVAVKPKLGIFLPQPEAWDRTLLGKHIAKRDASVIRAPVDVHHTLGTRSLRHMQLDAVVPIMNMANLLKLHRVVIGPTGDVGRDDMYGCAQSRLSVEFQRKPRIV